MIHPATELRPIDSTIGGGVFATEFIPRGTITWVRCALDRVLSPEAIDELGPAYRAILDRYAYFNRQGDSVLCWDLGRYMNHSCRPAVLSPGFDIDVAIRDIFPGDELTCEYALLNLDAPMNCQCGSEDCRKVIRSDDALLRITQWDVAVRAAFGVVLNVKQPLWPFLRETDDIVASARGDQPVPSVSMHLRRM